MSLIINNIDFAKQKKMLSGELSVAGFERLAVLEQVHTSALASTVITYQLDGLDVYQCADGALPMLRLSFEVQLPLQCQRCMGQVNQLLQLQFDYVICDQEPVSLEDVDDIDWLEPDLQMDVSALIEDELLMAMPIAPTHAEACTELKMESGEKLSPFAILKGKF